MSDWNVVVTVNEGHFRDVIDFLERFGPVDKTEFFNVLVLTVENTDRFLEELLEDFEATPRLETAIGRIMPASETFTFQTPAEFEARVTGVVKPWVPALAGRTFHVRMHRRGFKGRLSSQDEERLVAGFLLAKLEERGAVASVDFDDPDYVVDIETVGQRVGVALWAREQRLRYPFLRLD